MNTILSSSAELSQAVAALKRGGLVAFPTETVYGLGADASNPSAIARIYAAKGRPSNHPVIVHLSSADELERWARSVPEGARKLATRYWPGPLTLVLNRAPGVPDAVTGGQDTVGLRVPAHPLALALLRAFGGGVAAPSANKFGRISPTTAAHVQRDLGDEVDVILDGGPCEVGIESTIVDFSGGEPVLLRPGQLHAEQIEAVLGAPLRAPGSDAPRAPGRLESHYAPRRPLQLLSRAELQAALRSGSPERYAVLAFETASPGPRTAGWIQAPHQPDDYARDLYASLRALDALNCERILVESPPEGGEWAAVGDRLGRARSR
jgi:L-threonylcarbamoyladenylate synthase